MPNLHIICTLVQCSSAHTAPPTSSGNHPVSVINRRHLHGQAPPARTDATCTGPRADATWTARSSPALTPTPSGSHLHGQKQPRAGRLSHPSSLRGRRRLHGQTPPGRPEVTCTSRSLLHGQQGVLELLIARSCDSSGHSCTSATRHEFPEL